MNVMDLKHSSCQADEMCIVDCQSKAKDLLLSPIAKLFRITTNSGKVHYVWYESADNYEFEFPTAWRAFLEDDDMLDDDIFDIKSKQEIKPDEDIFCSGGFVYYLHREERGDLVIRRICAYSSQQIVEQIIAEDFRDIVVENIYLSNFYLIEGKGRKYVLTSWGVVYNGGFLYIPIFDEDRHYIYERPVTSYVREELTIGAVFCANGVYYQTATDENAKLYLRYADTPFAFNKATSRERVKPAKIVKMNFQR